MSGCDVRSHRNLNLARGNYAYAEVLHQDHRALKRLRTDKDGVVSFEYVIVAACIVAAVVLRSVILVPIKTALSSVTAIARLYRRGPDPRGHWDVPMPYAQHLEEEITLMLKYYVKTPKR